MKKCILISLIVIVASNLYCFKAFEINPFDFIHNREFEILKTFGINANDIPSRISVIEADNLREFINLSNAPYCAAGVTVDNIIYIQNRAYLLEKFNLTLKHEMFHVILHKLELPYWFEEGLVCELTGEWNGKERNIINVEEVKVLRLQTQWEMESYSYSCWLKVRNMLGF